MMTFDMHTHTHEFIPFYEFTVSKPLLLGLVVLLIQESSGIPCMVTYTAKIFSQSVSDINPNKAAMFVAGVQFIGTYTATMFVDRAGRKILFMVACVGTAMCQLVLATFIYLTRNGYDLSDYSWVPLISFGAALFIGSLGPIPIPYIILSEILPDKVRQAHHQAHENRDLSIDFHLFFADAWQRHDLLHGLLVVLDISVYANFPTNHWCYRHAWSYLYFRMRWFC